jgi:hypothetical protein
METVQSIDEDSRLPVLPRSKELPQEQSVRRYPFMRLTPWSRVILEKLIFAQLVEKFLAFYGTRKLNTVFTTARHRPCPQPDESSLHPPTQFPYDPF